MSPLTLYGAAAVTAMLIAYACEHRSNWWVLVFALACAASSLYGWLAGTWPFGVWKVFGQSWRCGAGCAGANRFRGNGTIPPGAIE
jgi:hypothetical protein